MKKRLSLILTVVLLSSFLTGCGSGSGNETGTDRSSSNSEKQTVNQSSGGENEESITDISWYLSTGVVPSTWNTDQYVMRTITEAAGVTISATTPADDADTKLNLMIVNGNLPDVLTLTNETLINDMIEADLVWSIEEFFQTYLPDSNLINGQFPEDIKNALISKFGGWYSIPSHILSIENREIWGDNEETGDIWRSADYRENGGVIFNKTIMDELGISEEDLTTESKVLEAFEKVKLANLEVGGASVMIFLADGNVYNGGSWESNGGALGVLSAFFGSMQFDADGNFQSNYYNNSFRHAVEFLNVCARNGYINANDFTMDRAAREAACRAGRVFCFMGNTADTGFADAGEWCSPGIIFSDGGETPTQGSSSNVGTGWLQTFIAKDTKNPEAVAQFLAYMTSNEGLLTWNYGDPTTDYTEDEFGLIKRTEAGQEKADNASVTGVGAFWAFCNQNFDRLHIDPRTDIGLILQCKRGDTEGNYIYDNAILTLPASYIESNSDMNNIKLEIETYAKTELISIILNATENSFDTMYQSFVDKLNALGLQELDEYVNIAVQNNANEYGYSLKAVN